MVEELLPNESPAAAVAPSVFFSRVPPLVGVAALKLNAFFAVGPSPFVTFDWKMFTFGGGPSLSSCVCPTVAGLCPNLNPPPILPELIDFELASFCPNLNPPLGALKPLFVVLDSELDPKLIPLGTLTSSFCSVVFAWLNTEDSTLLTSDGADVSVADELLLDLDSLDKEKFGGSLKPTPEEGVVILLLSVLAGFRLCPRLIPAGSLKPPPLAFEFEFNESEVVELPNLKAPVASPLLMGVLPNLNDEAGNQFERKKSQTCAD